MDVTYTLRGSDCELIYFNDDIITEDIMDEAENMDDFNLIIRTNPHIYYIMEFDLDTNSARIYNGHDEVELFHEHSMNRPFDFEYIEDNINIKVINDNDENSVRVFSPSEWRWLD